MSTVRLQIVDAIAAALAQATRLPLFRNLDYALDEINLPALVVISGDDVPSADSPLGAQYHDANLEITVLVAQSANPEADADPYEALIHATLMGGTVFASYPVMMNRLGASWSFDLGDCAARHLTYRVGFRTNFTDLEH